MLAFAKGEGRETSPKAHQNSNLIQNKFEIRKSGQIREDKIS